MGRGRPRARVWIVAAVLAAAVGLGAGAAPASAQDASSPLFDSDEPLRLTLTAPLEALTDDTDEDPAWRPATLASAHDDGSGWALEIRVQPRGHNRREVCQSPPLRLDFGDVDATGTPFAGQGELKLVVPCRPQRERYEQLVLTEYAAYRIYELLTDQAFRTRLVRATFADAAEEEEPWTGWAFLIEDEDRLAARLGGRVIDIPDGQNLMARVLEPRASVRVGVFQYMVGNPDWSDVADQNVALVLSLTGAVVPVPYDFDNAGLVDAPYAVPPDAFRLDSVRERIYRGWCWPLDPESVVAPFRQVEDEVVEVVRGIPGMTDDRRRSTLAYLEDFFEAVKTGERAERRFLRDCRALPR